MSTSSTNPDHVIKTPTSPVIIIGAGVAGLSAAKRLKENNIPVLILEGRNRLGGRIHTVAMNTQENNSNQEEGSTQKKAFVDMGAAWMDGGPQFNSLCRFAQDHGLTLVHTPYQENPAEIGRQHRAWDANHHKWLNWFQVNWLMFRNGMILRALEQQENKAQYQNMYQRVQQIYQQPGLLNLGKDHYDQMLAETFTVHNEAAFLTEIHPLNDDVAYFHVKDEYYKGTEYMIQGGYQKLIELLQEGIGEEEILLNHTVTSTTDHKSSDGVTVTTTQSTTNTNNNGITKTTFQGSHVIVTVPLGVLKTNNLLLFEPPLPPSKQGAIQRIGFGVLEKIAMTFPTTFWRTVPHRRQDVYHIGVEHPVDFPNFVDVTESAGAPTLVTTTVAKAQLVHDNPQEAVERVQSLLASMFGKLYQEPLDIQTTQWKTDPFSLGAYMHFGREMKPGDIELLAEPHGRIRFAGEATSTEYPSYVEGAALSGQREADRILAELIT
ncbi:Peroxisomal N(1)-acetyl-spermine/spermidine oxidase [Seminavis robusta]|uniref:Amine oxidase n=1 Tax=Seminavis robusta TaxID=568900 RepID=A0A9N8EN86_9STRA|nr:Peroxisomal N(1)-acetyl-spermine/spermidine oxidase [Seminavis robusta]|eukprot:Sro1456_g274230.1 Peroxisomal N(1)-acetyl-spermine/spermidine oxidase (492) ;mRNA; f:11430-12905